MRLRRVAVTDRAALFDSEGARPVGTSPAPVNVQLSHRDNG
jgi:hypothetical protein